MQLCQASLASRRLGPLQTRLQHKTRQTPTSTISSIGWRSKPRTPPPLPVSTISSRTCRPRQGTGRLPPRQHPHQREVLFPEELLLLLLVSLPQEQVPRFQCMACPWVCVVRPPSLLWYLLRRLRPPARAGRFWRGPWLRRFRERRASQCHLTWQIHP
eukprot:Rmarinus@m.12524